MCHFESTDETEAREMLLRMSQVFGPAGWDDPEMDIYDELDPRRESRLEAAIEDRSPSRPNHGALAGDGAADDPIVQP
jgi:hypothetical protein